MTDDAPLTLEPALYERWRMLASASADHDGLVMSAAAIDAATRDPVFPEIPSAAFLRRVQALVPAADAAAVVVPFRPRAAPQPRAAAWAAWGAVAASLVLISLMGFNVGVQTERNFNGVIGGGSIDLIDQSGAMLGDGVG